MSLGRGPVLPSPVAPPIFPKRILVLTEIRSELLAKRVPATGRGRASERTNDVEHASITESPPTALKPRHSNATSRPALRFLVVTAVLRAVGV
jgi:hypothetical protein